MIRNNWHLFIILLWNLYCSFNVVPWNKLQGKFSWMVPCSFIIVLMIFWITDLTDMYIKTKRREGGNFSEEELGCARIKLHFLFSQRWPTFKFFLFLWMTSLPAYSNNDRKSNLIRSFSWGLYYFSAKRIFIVENLLTLYQLSNIQEKCH